MSDPYKEAEIEPRALPLPTATSQNKTLKRLRPLPRTCYDKNIILFYLSQSLSRPYFSQCSG